MFSIFHLFLLGLDLFVAGMSVALAATLLCFLTFLLVSVAFVANVKGAAGESTRSQQSSM